MKSNILCIWIVCLLFISAGLFAQHISAPTPVVKNLALAKKAFTSANNGGTSPIPDESWRLLVDGDLSKAWTPGQNTSPFWFYVDLGEACMINRVILRWYGSYCPDRYMIGISQDGKNWSLPYTQNNCPGGVEELTSSQFIKIRYIGIYIPGSVGTPIGVLEFEVYGYTVDDTPSSLVTKVTLDDQGDTYTGEFVLKNPNAGYAWNGTSFNVKSLSFKTTSDIVVSGFNTTIDGDDVVVDLGWQSMFPYGKEVRIPFSARKSGASPYPSYISSNLLYSAGSIYSEYAGLPAGYYAGKSKLVLEDLVNDVTAYYQSDVVPGKDSLVVDTPVSDSQLLINLPYIKGLPIGNPVQGQIWLYSKYVAMGLALGYEWFTINPGYLMALGNVENHMAFLTPAEVTTTGIPIEYKGKTWYWLSVVDHVDGPFQLEAPAFDTLKSVYPDYLVADALHDDYIPVSIEQNDPGWITSPFTISLHLTYLREALASCDEVGYVDFIENAKDPHAELILISYAYSRGINALLAKKIFTDYRDIAMNTDDLITYFELGGFAYHVPRIKNMVEEINGNVVELYDEALSREDIVAFMDGLRSFYGNGVPSDAEWNFMRREVLKAFDVLAAHWGGQSVSFRYDFLTLMRVMKYYLPEPYVTRPTGEYFYYMVKNMLP